MWITRAKLPVEEPQKSLYRVSEPRPAPQEG